MFGHGGRPMIVFPTSMGAFFEYEDRGMIGALADKLEHGALQLICVSTVDTETFYAQDRHHAPASSGISPTSATSSRTSCRSSPTLSGSPTAGVTGCSFGAYHAFTMALRHPDMFTSCIPMGGAFDISRFLDGYDDLDSYLLSAPQFLPRLQDAWFLDRYRHNKWVLVTGEHDICRADTEQAAGLLRAKGIPHSLHVWEHGSEHDWPEWRKMAAVYIP